MKRVFFADSLHFLLYLHYMAYFVQQNNAATRQVGVPVNIVLIFIDYIGRCRRGKTGEYKRNSSVFSGHALGENVVYTVY